MKNSTLGRLGVAFQKFFCFCLVLCYTTSVFFKGKVKKSPDLLSGLAINVTDLPQACTLMRRL